MLWRWWYQLDGFSRRECLYTWASLAKVEVEEQATALLLFLHKSCLKFFSTLALLNLKVLHLYALEGQDIALPTPATEDGEAPLCSERQNCTTYKRSLNNVPGRWVNEQSIDEKKREQEEHQGQVRQQK
jgi:hypothetical protein